MGEARSRNPDRRSNARRIAGGAAVRSIERRAPAALESARPGPFMEDAMNLEITYCVS